MKFNGKNKALTFSYDDGVTQDLRLIEILKKYNLKATFNLNSGLLGVEDSHIQEGIKVNLTRNKAEDIAKIYEGFECAVHSVHHNNLTLRTEAEIISEVNDDKVSLEKILGYEIVGMAYPCGGVNCNDYTADIIRRNTSIKYARNIKATDNFDLQDDLFQFTPTMHHIKDINHLFEMGEKFIDLKTDEPKLFYVWGHSFEFDIHDTWSVFEDFCKMISRREDIFYGTNKEVLL